MLLIVRIHSAIFSFRLFHHCPVLLIISLHLSDADTESIIVPASHHALHSHTPVHHSDLPSFSHNDPTSIQHAFHSNASMSICPSFTCPILFKAYQPAPHSHALVPMYRVVQRIISQAQKANILFHMKQAAEVKCRFAAMVTCTIPPAEDSNQHLPARHMHNRISSR